jgi:hypothetical protein
MATLRKRGDKWNTQVRLKGRPAITKSFTHRAAAEAWGRQQEVALETDEEIHRGDPIGMIAEERLPSFRHSHFGCSMAC